MRYNAVSIDDLYIMSTFFLYMAITVLVGLVDRLVNMNQDRMLITVYCLSLHPCICLLEGFSTCRFVHYNFFMKYVNRYCKALSA